MPSSSYSISLLNTRSAVLHSADLGDLIEELQPNLFFLTETWFSSDLDPSILDILPQNYLILSKARKCRTGGGVALIYRDTFSFKPIILTSEPTSFEYLAGVGGPNTSSPITFLCIYHPPENNDIFLEELHLVLEHLHTSAKRFILCGDLNIHLNDPLDPATIKLKDILEHFDISSPFHEPSHRLGNQLDYIGIRELHSYDHLTSPIPWSDHCMLSMFLHNWNHAGSSYSCSPVPARISRHNFRHLNSTTFQQHWAPFSDATLTTSELDAIFFAKLSLVRKILCPLQSIRKAPPHHLKNKWFTEEIRTKRREGRRLQKQWTKTHCPLALERYSRFQRQYKLLIKKSKANYIQTQIQMAPNRTKALFHITQALSTTPQATNLDLPPPEVFSQSVADFFISKVSDIRQAIDLLPPQPELQSLHLDLVHKALHPSWPIFCDPSCSDTSLSSAAVPAFTHFHPVPESTIRRIILSLGPASSVLDPLPTTIIKQLVDDLLPDITRLVNSSLTSGEVPASWKTGVITPLPKKVGADISNFKNLRPITQLCILPRVTEAIVAQQLQEHLERHHLFHECQSGFRPGRGTESATLDIRDQALWSADANHSSLLTLLDLSAAFDTVDHAILLQRATEVAGIQGVALRWLGSFLSNRHQVVKWHDHLSGRAPVPWGVPQGSSLSPLLFNIYLRPLAALLEVVGLRFQMFADDTQILTNLHKSSTDLTKLVPCLVLLQEWMRLNKLRLNPDKTELLVMGQNPQDPLPTIPWPTSWGSMPTPVLQARNLGVEFSHQLSGDAHVHKVVKSCHHQLNILARLFPLLGQGQRVTLYQALVESRLRYGLIHLLGAPQKVIFPLQKVQNRALRLIFQLDYRTHLSSYRNKLGWLSICNLIKEKACHLLWKAKRNKGPAYLQKWAGLPTIRRSRRTPNLHRSHLPKFNKTWKGGSTLAVAGGKIWNTLPSPLHRIDSWPMFRKALKAHLLSSQFSFTPGPPPRSCLSKPISVIRPSHLSIPPSSTAPLRRSPPTGFPTGLCSPPLPLRNNIALIQQAELSKRLNTSVGGTYAPRPI